MARKFDRPAPGNRYTAEQRAEWGRQQDIARAERALRKEVLKPKRPSRAKELVADCSGSSCFEDLRYKNGVVHATFIGPAAGTWDYEMSRADAKSWFDDESLGGWFNDELR